jgi:hypothetical protein
MSLNTRPGAPTRRHPRERGCYLSLVGPAVLLDQGGEVVLGRVPQARMSVRIAPTDRCDADAQHLPGKREQLEIDTVAARAGIPQVRQVGLDRAAAARLEIDPAKPRRRGKHVMGVRAAMEDRRRPGTLQKRRRHRGESESQQRETIPGKLPASPPRRRVVDPFAGFARGSPAVRRATRRGGRAGARGSLRAHRRRGRDRRRVAGSPRA